MTEKLKKVDDHLISKVAFFHGSSFQNLISKCEYVVDNFFPSVDGSKFNFKM